MSKGSSKSVLLVDDDEVIRRLMRRAIATLPREVEICEAEDGLDALKWLEKRSFDLVVLDIKMPSLNGMEVLRKVRENEATKDLNVVMLTSENQMEDIYKGLQGGATSYLTKPFDVEEVISVFEAHFSGNLDKAPDELTNDW